MASITSYLSTNSNIYAGLPSTISTEAGMTSATATGLLGRIIKYIGETTENFENGTLYMVVEDE